MKGKGRRGNTKYGQVSIPIAQSKKRNTDGHLFVFYKTQINLIDKGENYCSVSPLYILFERRSSSAKKHIPKYGTT
jgi:hypothetical protein